jgi:hypothetical protein
VNLFPGVSSGDEGILLLCLFEDSSLEVVEFLGEVSETVEVVDYGHALQFFLLGFTQSEETKFHKIEHVYS